MIVRWRIDCFYLVQVGELVGLDVGALRTSSGSHTVPDILAKLADGIASFLQKAIKTFLVDTSVGTQVSLQEAFQVLGANSELQSNVWLNQ